MSRDVFFELTDSNVEHQRLSNVRIETAIYKVVLEKTAKGAFSMKLFLQLVKIMHQMVYAFVVYVRKLPLVKARRKKHHVIKPGSFLCDKNLHACPLWSYINP